MTIEEHTNVINQINTTANNPELQPLLLQLTDDYTNTVNTNDNLQKQLNAMTEERNKYAKLNNDLWLRVNTQDDTIEHHDNNDSDKHEPKRTFENLNFD